MNGVRQSALQQESAGVRWREVALFVGLTFALTWGLDLLLYLASGYGSTAAMLALQLQMLLPAFSAIILGMFVFKGSPLHVGAGWGRAHWFFGFFLIYTLLYAALAVGAVAQSEQVSALSMIGFIATEVGLVVAVVVRLIAGSREANRTGLAFGKPKYWLIFGLGFALYYMLQVGLNYAFGLGHPVDVSPLASQMGVPAETFVILAAVQGALLGPFMGLLIAFGEEYGWRGYLQGELVKLGRARGVLIVGLIWGLWHAPVIAMGHNYPGYPVLGPILMVAMTVLLAYALGYAVLKTGSVWLAAFLHAVNNQVYSFLVGVVHAPNDPVFSFGAGLYGLAVGAVVVLLILRDGVWKEA